ncbi:hypothetical protein HHK36_005530 [Tetracentron sinense]|uniref:Uncharacterized protein n=1 Tax=Tetracentron sinense TaxID=13715 RepID=A0A834ZKT5_TETSI|nr:hypothetical protein HHK36_005530 [Tetracentron sinense]
MSSQSYLAVPSQLNKMALLSMPVLIPSGSITWSPPKRHVPVTTSGSAFVNRYVRCISSTQTCQTTVVRRSGNYQPCIWDYEYVQSLRSHYVGETYTRQAEKLKGDVRVLFNNTVEPLARLELIDVLQRLGLAYHFEEEIKRTLETINVCSNKWTKEDLYATALHFRLLRQHRYQVPQEVFSSFKDKMGNFKASLCEDTKGMLSLYEASYLSLQGEVILDEARDFTSRHLKDIKENIDLNLAKQVSHALELPLHWSMLRLEARWFIDIYERREDRNPILLELAKLDFNMVQAIYQNDLRDMSRWWKNLGLGEQLSFARDRLMESFLWTVGMNFEPQFGYCRRMSTKVNVLITIIDDVYDVYGTLDELELFTDAIQRWDINAMQQLPHYMKICFLALYNSTNEMAYDILKEQGVDIIIYLKKAWADLCKAYLEEARCYNSGYTPTLDEYLNNACISIAAPIILVNAYIFMTKQITKEELEYLECHPNIIRWSSMLLRLSDDLGTSKDEIMRGDTPKSIQCYMHENGASEEAARLYIMGLISDTWKKMNADRVSDSLFAQTFIETTVNLGRMAQCMYQHGDGHGVQDRETKDRVLSLLVEPIPLSVPL